MSEYQYYEFRSIDRPLTKQEMGTLRTLSTRAEITPTSFTNTYHWGDFKGNPTDLMDRFFDAFVYVANWGTHCLMFRIPCRLNDVNQLSAYCDGEVLSLKAYEEHVVLEFRSDDESGEEWSTGESWMPSLISLRADLLRGDLRALYLAWLASLPLSQRTDEEEDREPDEPEDDLREPPVPAGLKTLSAPLKALADFLRLDETLIEVAAMTSEGEPPALPSSSQLNLWIKKLPVQDKEAYLSRFLTEESHLLLHAEMTRRFLDDSAPKVQRSAQKTERRTVSQLLESRNTLAKEKKRKATEQAAQERARREREQAKARARYLDDLAARELATWREVDSFIATKRPQDYDRAITLLIDLRDLAARSDRVEETTARVREIRRRFHNRPSLLKRLDQHKLGT